LQNSLKKYYLSKNYIANNILTGNGLKELLFILQLAFDGKIIHITPSWVSYKEHLTILGKLDNLIEIETFQQDDYKINLTLLISILNKYKDNQIMIIFNNPNNPTGIVYQADYVKNIAEILKKYNVIIMADEIYLNVSHNNKNVCSISDYLPKQTIIGSSISKDIGCGGYRLGWMIFPTELEYLYNKCSSLASSIYSCPNIIMQHATAEFLNHDNISVYKEYLHYENEIFKNNIRVICDTIDKQQNNKKKKIRYSRPNAAWYIVLNFIEYKSKLSNIGIINSRDLSKRILNNYGIVTVPGICFNSNELILRLSLVDFDDNLDISNMIEGINILCKFCNDL
jgi:aspartate aminotransferase